MPAEPVQSSESQYDALATGGSVRVEANGLECVLMRADVFERVERIFADDWTDEEMMQALARSSKENGWDEPGMEAYDDYPQP